jgi:hypothetical protein
MTRPANFPAWVIPPQVKRDFAGVRGRVLSALAASRQPVTLSAALAQVARIQKATSTELSKIK